eukprot:2312804-Amphidinium_carterae.1
MTPYQRVSAINCHANLPQSGHRSRPHLNACGSCHREWHLSINHWKMHLGMSVFPLRTCHGASQHSA